MSRVTGELEAKRLGGGSYIEVHRKMSPTLLHMLMLSAHELHLNIQIHNKDDSCTISGWLECCYIATIAAIAPQFEALQQSV